MFDNNNDNDNKQQQKTKVTKSTGNWTELCPFWPLT